MNIRRLSNYGIGRFAELLDSLNLGLQTHVPKEMLTDSAATEVISPPIEIENRLFANRYAAAEYLYNTFRTSALKNIEHDQGLWSWLSLYYFEQLCARDAQGRLRPGARARWIPEISSFQRYYRHLLLQPFSIYALHAASPENVQLLLSGTLDKPGEIAEQIASRQEIITNVEILKAASILYFDFTSKKPKRGAAGKDSGSIRRFIAILNQFDVNWDLYSIKCEILLEMLPREFSRFKESPK